MNGFTTTETDATERALTAQDAERVHMALAEAGRPDAEVYIDARGEMRVHWPQFFRPSNGTALWTRALDVAGIVRRCSPCHYAAPRGTPRVSPDCEGTGRCSVES